MLLLEAGSFATETHHAVTEFVMLLLEAGSVAMETLCVATET